MWISTLYLEPKRVLLTKLLGLFYPDIYYSSISPLQVQNLPREPLPSASWVRVRNRLAGICGSDLQLIFANADPRIAPAALPGYPQLYPGHEVVGEVIEIGDDVHHLQVGDRVVLQNAPNCVSTGIYSPCRSCEAGNYNLCEQGVLPGPQPIGGGWSEEMLLHEQQLFRIPKQLSDEQGVLLEPTAVAVHAVLRHLPQPGDKVLIIGAGTIGLLTLQVIRALAPQAKVSILARHAPQRELAKRMGATYLIHPTDSYGEMQQVTGAQLYRGIFGNRTLLGGYDVIYDTVGRRDTLYHALRWTRAQASIVLIGVSLHMMHIDLTPIWHQQINLLGATSHGMETWPPQTQQRISTFSIAAELMIQDRIHPEELITHHFALNNYKDALITATRKARSHAIKVVFDFSLQPASAVPNPKALARTPLPLSPKTLQKPVNALPHEHAKDELRQLRLSLGLGSTASKAQLASPGEIQPTIEAVQEDSSSAIKNAVVPVDQDQATPTDAETLSQIGDSDQTATDAIKTQEPVVQDRPDGEAEPASTSRQEEQTFPMDDTPTPIALDRITASKSETAQLPTDLLLEEPLPSIEEDIQPTLEMAQVTSTEERPKQVYDFQKDLEMAQITSIEERESTENGSVSPVQAEKKNEVTSDNDVPSFPEVENTPTVRVRSKRGSRKRKTKPFA